MEENEKRQNKYSYIITMVFVACVTAVITFYITYEKYGDNTNIKMETASEDSSENLQTIATTLQSFRDLIDEYYIGEIDEQKVLDETIKGYINGLDDEYSEYMTAEEWSEYQASALGNYVGIGIYMSLDTSGNIVILEPIEGSPAEAVGLKTGDIIVEVDGVSTIGSTTSDVATKVKGVEGTKVKLKIARENEYLDFEVERKEIKVYHVKSKMLEDNIGYIELSTFDEGCADEFKNALEDIKSKGSKKLIVDLRDNTGGLVDEALEIIDMFVEKGKDILITVDSDGNKDVNVAKIDPIVTDMDIVVLVNEYSASASEIFVGALKDNGVATIVGTTTYGKGVIQNVFSLTDGSVLKLTTAEYFTPNETKINKVGIEPDIKVEENAEGTENTEENEDVALNKGIEILQNLQN